MRNLRLASWALASGVALWSFSGVAMAERRVALVVGNSEYQHVPHLYNTRNDATGMAKALGDLEFEVILGIDLDRHSFVEKLKEFKKATEGASAALFFYAGHASQYQGNNYLTPIDATELEDEVDYENHIKLGTVMDRMRSTTKLVFLDACRDNPLEKRFRTRSRSGSPVNDSNPRGLAVVERKPGGSYIAYATEPGDLAQDGDAGGNSPFTAALLKHIRTPNVPVSGLMTRVRKLVLQNTGYKQRPWDSSSLEEEFFFAKSGVVTTSPPPPQSDPGVYLKFGVGAGQKIEEAHLEVAAEGRISENEVRNYSMVRGGCYSQGISARTRLEWRHIGLCTR